MRNQPCAGPTRAVDTSAVANRKPQRRQELGVFNHYQRRGKCEWYEGLADFVAEYNRRQGSQYVRSDCLDITRVGSQTAKQPEVLVTDKHTGNQMVIERKSVVWPPSYIQRHENEHQFAETIWQITRGRFQDASYALCISGTELEILNQHDTRRVAAEIGTVLLSLDSARLPIRRPVPVGWAFGISGEHEDRLGITVIQQSPMRIEDFTGTEVSAHTAMAQQLAAAAPKFVGYENARRVVLLDFYGKTLHEGDIPALMPDMAVPDCIDEIWMTTREWISEDDFAIGFARIFDRQ